MAIEINWYINEMQRNVADGGVFNISWTCSGMGRDPERGRYGANASGTMKYQPDASAPDFVPFEDLTQEMVFNWIYESLIEEGSSETAEDAKNRVEQAIIEKAEAELAQRKATASGVPWSAEQV